MPNNNWHDLVRGAIWVAFGIVLALAMWGWALVILGGGR